MENDINDWTLRIKNNLKSVHNKIVFEINTRYLIKKELGKGAYGTVYLAMDRQTGEQ